MKKKNKTLRYLIIAVVVLIVFAIIGKKAGWFGGKEKKEVAVEKVSSRTIVESVSASGKVQPEVEVKISPDVSGEIVELHVKEGEHVKQGTLLAKILPDIYQSNVDRMVASVNASRANMENARSRLAQAKSQMERARNNFDRNKKLFDDKLISPSEWESVKSAYEVAKAESDAAQQSVAASEFNIQSTQAALKEAQDNLKKTSIFAPVDGTISKLNVEKGERVVGTTQMAGTEMMILANLNEMEVNVDVNENDIMRVNAGDTARIEVDAYLGKEFKGIVTEVANSANVTGLSADQATSFKVKVRIFRESYESIKNEKNPSRPVFNPGMSATVEIMTNRVANVLSVPIQAVTTRDTSQSKPGGGKKEKKKEADEMEEVDGVKLAEKETKKSTATKDASKTECVFLVNEDGTVKLQPVTIGIQDNTYIEIKAGLTEGQEVVSAPYSAIARQLKDGDKIEKVEKEKLFKGE